MLFRRGCIPDNKVIKMIRNEKGFTLIEIIAVLVILGIMAAVAVPKYIDMQEEARKNAAQAAIAEVKGRATSYYSLKLLRTGAAPTLTAVLSSVGTPSADVGNDFTVATADDGSSNIKITVSKVKGVDVTPVISTWMFPR